MQTRVIKVGGSLLEHDQLVVELRRWLDAQPVAHHVLVVGGGDFVEMIRRWNDRLALPDVKTHWLCIRIMDVTARTLALLIPELPFLDQFEPLRLQLDSKIPQLLIFSCEEFLRCWESSWPGHVLPTGWDVSSDSIAARLARAISADELVLLKSTDPPIPRTLDQAAGEGYVDAHFPRAALEIRRVRCVNLLARREFELHGDKV